MLGPLPATLIDMAIRITFTIILLLYSFESLLSQSTNFEQPPLTVKKIQTEFIELASKYLEVSISNRDSASKLNDKMISKLLELYNIDSTIELLGFILLIAIQLKMILGKSFDGLTMR